MIKISLIIHIRIKIFNLTSKKNLNFSHGNTQKFVTYFITKKETKNRNQI